MPDESPRASIDLDLVTKIVAAFVWRNQVTRSTRERYRDRLSRAWATWQTSGRTGRRAETSGSCSEIRDQGSRNLSDLRMARGNAASAPLDRPRSQPGPIWIALEAAARASDDRAGLLGAPIDDGEAV